MNVELVVNIFIRMFMYLYIYIYKLGHGNNLIDLFEYIRWCFRNKANQILFSDINIFLKLSFPLEYARFDYKTA